MVENVGSRLHIEPDRRLIQQQQTRPMHQRASYLKPPHLSARKIPHLAAVAVSKSDP